MSKAQDFALKCRQHLFRAQVARFRDCLVRAPLRGDIRLLWRETAFRTA